MTAPTSPLSLVTRIPAGRGALLVAVLGALAEHGFAIGAGATAGWVVGSAATGAPAAVLWPPAAVVLGCVVASAVGSWTLGVYGHAFAFRYQAALRLRVFDGLARSAPQGTAERSGDLAAVAMGDVDELEGFFAHLGIGAVAALATGIGSTVALGFLHPLLAVIGGVGALAVALLPMWAARRGKVRGAALRGELGTVNADVVDGVQGLRELLVFGHLDAWYERISRGTRGLRRHRYAQARAAGLQAAVTDALVAVTTIGILITVLGLVGGGALTLPAGAAALLLAVAALGPVAAAADMAGTLAPLRASAQRVAELLDRPAGVPDTGTRRPERGAAHVRFEGVGFAYPGRDLAVADVDIDIPAGHTVALVGRSGAGKSTCANLMLRFWDPDSGRITVNGHDLRDYALDALPHLVTVVAQDVHLFDGSIADNLRLARPDASDDELRAAAVVAQADGFVTTLPDGYDTQVGERGAMLSGGQRQRLTIARALLADTPVLVLDEASSNLDTENERLVHAALDGVRAGRTILVIAHRLATVRAADTIVVLDRGRVVETGSHTDLLAAGGPYAELMAHQSEGVALVP